MPTPVSDLLVVLLAVVGAGFAGYRAPHTPRTDTAPPDPEPTRAPRRWSPVTLSPVPAGADPEPTGLADPAAEGDAA